ncbi:MAG: hypothetical protein LBJ99_02750, partial [Oscillospiraceae bacterium]|nr:hypothetical protein [Oscillospiraceae bacterium]
NGITTVDAANEFLQRYVYAYNSRFAVEPEDTDKVFSKLPGRAVPQDGDSTALPLGGNIFTVD